MMTMMMKTMMMMLMMIIIIIIIVVVVVLKRYIKQKGKVRITTEVEKIKKVRKQRKEGHNNSSFFLLVSTKPKLFPPIVRS